MLDEKDDAPRRGWPPHCVELDTPVLAMIADVWKALRTGIEKYWRVIQYVCIGVALVLVGGSLYANWSNLSALDWKLDYVWFAVSLLLVSMAVLSLAVWWTLSIRLLGGQLGWKRGARIWAFAQLAKYLPGGIWNYASRVVACDRVGISKSRATLSLVIETVLRIQSAVLVLLSSLPFWPESEWRGVRLLLVVGILLSGFLVLNPRILDSSINLVLRILGKPVINNRLRVMSRMQVRRSDKIIRYFRANPYSLQSLYGHGKLIWLVTV